MSTGTYGHLQADDRDWFVEDSLTWLIEQDRGEPPARDSASSKNKA